jgi:hypothetical protein
MLEKSFEQPPVEQMPQLRKSGISSDYINEFAALKMGVSISKSNPKMSREIMSIFREKVNETGKLILDYEERFPQTKFSDVITDKNRDAIAEINELAKKCNEKFVSIETDPDLTDEDKLKQITSRILPHISRMQQLIEAGDEKQTS